MASIGAIFTSTYRTKQLNSWPKSSASHVFNYSQLTACQGDMKPFEGDPSSCGHLTNLRNKLKQKQPGQLSASVLAWIVSQSIQLSFDGEKCVLLLCLWNVAFLKSGHTYTYVYTHTYIYTHILLGTLVLNSRDWHEKMATKFFELQSTPSDFFRTVKHFYTKRKVLS